MFNDKKTNLLDTLRTHVGSKSDYLPRTLAEARADLVQRAQATIGALRDGKVRPYHPAPMAKQQRKTEQFCVKIGYGGNNAYLANTAHKASQVLKYDTANEAASDIENLIIPAAEAGEFDDGLMATLEKHRELADNRKKKIATNRAAFNVETQSQNIATSTVVSG